MRIRALAVLAVLVATLAACGSGESATPTADKASETTKPADGPDLSGKDFEDLTASSTVEVQARDNTFNAPYIEVKAGTEVSFINKGRNQHNVVPTVNGAFVDIPTDEFEPGESASITFDDPGEYPYYCTLHGTKTKGMVGAIRVLQ